MHVHVSVCVYMYIMSVYVCVYMCLCTFRDLESGLSATCVNTRKEVNYA